MTWFAIDPVAAAIIESLESQPERWKDTDSGLLLDSENPYDAPLRLWKWPVYEKITVERPAIALTKRSRSALWKAYERWKSTGVTTQEQKNRALILAALGQRESGE